MEVVEKSIQVDAPLSSVYNQWTQYEDFPEFMKDVEEVRQITDKRLHWKARIGGKQKEWDSEIVEQVPDERISWRSTSGARNSGTIRFLSLGENRTRIDVQIEYEPEGALENVGDAFGVLSRRLETDLEQFKHFIESHQEASAWRGRTWGQEVHAGADAPRSKRIH